MDRPTIGVAKSLLCGIVRENNFIDVDGVNMAGKMPGKWVQIDKGKKETSLC
jgi:deoxyinosine 3'endonuclease (endonuclease V)